MCPSSGIRSHRRFEISSSCMYTQTFAQTMTCAHERTLGNSRIHLRKHARNGHGARCPAARREKLPARLWLSRWTAAQWMGKISMWKANEKYISPQEKDNTCAMRLQTSSKTAHGIAAIQCGASPKPRLAHMRRCIIRARRWRRPNVFSLFVCLKYHCR